MSYFLILRCCDLFWTVFETSAADNQWRKYPGERHLFKNVLFSKRFTSHTGWFGKTWIFPNQNRCVLRGAIPDTQITFGFELYIWMFRGIESKLHVLWSLGPRSTTHWQITLARQYQGRRNRKFHKHLLAMTSENACKCFYVQAFRSQKWHFIYIFIYIFVETILVKPQLDLLKRYLLHHDSLLRRSI